MTYCILIRSILRTPIRRAGCSARALVARLNAENSGATVEVLDMAADFIAGTSGRIAGAGQTRARPHATRRR